MRDWEREIGLAAWRRERQARTTSQLRASVSVDIQYDQGGAANSASIPGRVRGTLASNGGGPGSCGQHGVELDRYA